MKKQLKNKLVLDRETVATLQSDALDAVAGGCVNCTLTSRPTSGLSQQSVASRLLGCGDSQISRQISWGGGAK